MPLLKLTHHLSLPLPQVLLLLSFLLVHGDANGKSAVGDPGMRRHELNIGFESWNFCNKVGSREAPGMGSPRAADCFHFFPTNGTVNHRVSDEDNKLGVGKSFPGLPPKALHNPDLYAVEKELYLGSLCQQDNSSHDGGKPWQFWMIMLKNGNYDTKSGLCPENGKKKLPFIAPGKFPCYGQGCMNQPLINHQPTTLISSTSLDATADQSAIMRGSFNGTYDYNSLAPFPFPGGPRGGEGPFSYFEVVWEKEVAQGGAANNNARNGWIFKHKLKTSKLYPWLMLYLRADATKGFSGGYPYETRGMLHTLPESPNFKVRLSLDVKQGGGSKSQFYLIDIGSCWKNNGKPCDGDVLTDVTRYSEMIINPETPAWCSPSGIGNCPPYHITSNNTKIFRNDTARFPYAAYHYYCAPGNARNLEPPYSTCDPYSNPQAQEIVQLLPHRIWADYGYPTKKGDGWIGDPRTWELDVGALSERLYFYQDPGTSPARRIWTSIDVGTEIFVSDRDEVAEWTLSDFDVLLTSDQTSSAAAAASGN